MSYKTETEIKSSYVYAYVSGEQSFENHKELALYLSGVCAKENKDRVMINIRGIYGQSPGSIKDFQLAQFLQVLLGQTIRKIAVIYLPENEQYIRFFETAARNHGIDLRVFLDVEEASGWLISG
jgi:hypothetical protein